jgi:hypothetical protein
MSDIGSEIAKSLLKGCALVCTLSFILGLCIYKLVEYLINNYF